MSLVDLVQQHLGPAELQQISQQLGVDQPTAQRAVDAAVPGLVAGMAGQAQEQGGAGAIEGLLGSHGNILGNLGGLLGAGAPADGGGILGDILGRHSDTVGQDVSRSTGLDGAKTRQLLMILAPIVLGALAHRRKQAASASPGASPAQPDLGSVLEQEAQHAQTKSPGVGGLLGKILSHVETQR
jgi:hypothetical protein